jgi:thiol:disulfide interchange protein
MYATAVWLLWVVAIQAGAEGVLVTAGGAVLIGLAAWALRLAGAGGVAGRRIAAGTALAAGLGAAALLVTLARAPEAAAPVAGPTLAGGAGEGFTPARLAGLRGAGTPVFVNMTAAWCVTCIVNEQVALSRPAVQDAFARAGVTYLKGDWTRRDPAITDYLRALGRDGVPLYVLYPRGGAAVVLPQILTEQRVLDELARAGL